MIECSFKSCKTTPRFEITYDCGTTTQPLILCDNHYKSDPVFQLHIKKIEEIKN